ncbi:hypothetical protein MES4922_300263 [Mesorhizobium ventifaucium]|uniref:Uncharacterized protein n=1 Tax=Mesorhizobium ventifaucium TaxID=666020 RepID=A0ABM9E2A8_9HYPH|nr:hypothetical protein MES4922_300263 [Mesorhizobium ventifaucium]
MITRDAGLRTAVSCASGTPARPDLNLNIPSNPAFGAAKQLRHECGIQLPFTLHLI